MNDIVVAPAGDNLFLGKCPVIICLELELHPIADHRVRREPQRLSSIDPVEFALRDDSGSPSSRAASRNRNLRS
jgi:hypothetical protein